MNASIRIGRIAGVEIGLHWSWVLVVALIVWSLAVAVFPETTPGLSDGVYLVMAVVATVLFFGSLLLHELGHARQAQREDMKIEGIVLWLFGGIAQFRGAFPSAGAEFRIAIAGPVVTLVIGGLATGIALAISWPAEVDGVLLWLGEVNLILLGFNLIPALPLDGGRMLRAALWSRRRDFLAATRQAAGLGRTFGQILIGFGVFIVIAVGALGGLWLAFIGWFLLGAAEAELASAETHAALTGVRVRDAMIADPVTTTAELPLSRFMDDVFLVNRFASYPVLERAGGRPVGIVSYRSVLAVPRDRWPGKRVLDVMTPTERLPELEPNMDLEPALEELATSPSNRAPVLERGRLVGLLSITDATRLIEAARARTAPVRAALGALDPASPSPRA